MEKLKILVIGSGGREYELGRQMTLAPNVTNVYFAPGNGGSAALAKATNMSLGPTDVEAITEFVQKEQIDLTIIGPDAAVAAGVGNALRRAGKPVFGPTKEAGRLEASKAFASEFMDSHGIAQPDAVVVRSLEEAQAAIKDRKPYSYVLKADGLAAGKGVILPETESEAEQTLQAMFDGSGFEGAGKDAVVIQERLHGPELSAFAITDGANFVLLPLTQDHKRLKDNDEGPNTGGMGAYAPALIANDKQQQQIRDIVQKTIDGAREDGILYQGALYVGLMLAEERGGDPVVIEYNARFGDPETEVLLPILTEQGVDVPNMLIRTAKSDIGDIKVPESTGTSALTVTLAAAGYPESPRKGDQIFGLDEKYEGVVIQHAGTKHEDGKWLTAAGRVLYVTGFGKDINQAADRAYAAIGKDGIHFDGMQYRLDIGHQIRA